MARLCRLRENPVGENQKKYKSVEVQRLRNESKQVSSKNSKARRKNFLCSEVKHQQITILENRIALLEKENRILKASLVKVML